MHKDKAYEHILKNISADEELIGFSMAQKPFILWLLFLIGPLAILTMRSYFIGVTSKGIHFHALNLVGKFSQHDFFTYDEISHVKISRGTLQIPMKFTFKSGRKLKLNVQRKGLGRVAKLDDKALEFIKNSIHQV